MQKERQTPLESSGILHPLRTLIVDDSTLFLTCVRRLLDTQALIQVVGTAANGHEAVHQADVLLPDLVLMDLDMPGMNGLEATVLLRGRLPNTRIIIMTLDETVKTKAAASAHGAHGFVGKPHMIRTLMAEIRRVFRPNDADDKRGIA